MPYNIKSILNSYGFEKSLNNNNIYIKLFEALKTAISNGALTENVKMPPSRVFANDMEISRSTVIKAYELLVFEKYLFSIPGSGYYVSSVSDKKIQQVRFENKVDGKYPKISRRAKSFVKNTYTIDIKVPKGVPFRPGLPPLDIFPINTWKKLSNDYWKNVKSSELSYSNSYGLLRLREQISNYLKIYRNIDCSSDQIIVTTGSLHSLYLLTNALVDKNDEVVMENPIYPHAHSLFKSLNANICYANIDNEGIDIEEVKCNQPKLVYTTPSNQSPTGIKMSSKRRLELLNWASLKNTIVVEDDYDHEFSNWEKPISALYSMDKEQRVVYLGTFNKLLHPSIRLGYMVVPNFLINPINSLYEQSSRFVPSSIQTIMSSFIEKDHINVHLRNVIEVAEERKELFISLFREKFEDRIKLDPTNSGLHIIGNLEDEINDMKLVKFLSKQGIETFPLSYYYHGETKKMGLVMGFCSVRNILIKENLNKMAEGYAEFLKING